MISEAPTAVRDVLRLLLAADSYPRLGNHDWHEADLLDGAAKDANGLAARRRPAGIRTVAWNAPYTRTFALTEKPGPRVGQ